MCDMSTSVLITVHIILIVSIAFENTQGSTEHIILTVTPKTPIPENNGHIWILDGTPYNKPLAISRRVFYTQANTRLVSCDVDVANDLLYVVDQTSSTIDVITNIRPGSEGINAFAFHSGVSAFLYLKIAVDWISNNVYWVDPLHQWIAVQSGTKRKTDDTFFKVLIDERLDQPTALALDPFAGFLFWSNRLHYATIERSNLMGTERRTLLFKGLGHPISITADHSTSKIFWVDTIRHSVETSDYNGENRKILNRLSHRNFFDIAWYKDSLIVTERRYDTVLFLNKENGNVEHFVYTINDTVFGVAMFSSLTQPVGNSGCLNMNCSELCFGSGSGPAVCSCRTGFILDTDGRTCLEDKGKYYRALVVSNLTNVCRMTLQLISHSGSNSGEMDCTNDVTAGLGDGGIQFLDIDSNTGEFIYTTTTNIYKVDVKGENRRFLTSSLEIITGLSYDWTNGNVYFSSGTTHGNINVIDQQNVATIIDVEYPMTLFWISKGNGVSVIEKSSLTGTDRKTIVTSGQLFDPKSIAIDHQRRKLYWIDKGYIRTCTFEGYEIEIMETDKAFYNPDLVIVYKEYLIWTNDITQTMSQANVVFKSSPNITSNFFNFTSVGKFQSVRVLDSSLQTREHGPCELFNGGCDHICLPNGRDRECLCRYGFKRDNLTQSCSASPLFDNFIIFTDWTHKAIYQVSFINLEVNGLNADIIGRPTGVAFDHIRNLVIWGETEPNVVKFTKLDMSETNILSETGYLFDAYPVWFYIDQTSGNIFYTAVPTKDGGFSGIGVLTLEGKHRKLITNGNKTRAIVLDKEEGLMIWTDYGEGKVWKAYMDGSDKNEVPVSDDLKWPNGIAIDQNAGLTDGQKGFDDGVVSVVLSVSQTEIMCRNRVIIVHADKDSSLMSIFLSGEYLYYTSWNNPFVTRLDKNSFTQKLRLAENPELGRLDDLMVYNSSEQKDPHHAHCSPNKGRGPCSTFCLPRGRNGFKCACEDGISLLDDGFTCNNMKPANTGDKDVGKANNRTGIIIGASTASGLTIIILVCVQIVIFVRRRRQNVQNSGERSLQNRPIHFVTSRPACIVSVPNESSYDDGVNRNIVQDGTNQKKPGFQQRADRVSGTRAVPSPNTSVDIVSSVSIGVFNHSYEMASEFVESCTHSTS